jgi:Arc/MetJ-type ribon-helix-helix transcriptional regulator
MTIETQRPELEALINERMKTGAFKNVEDVIMQALKTSPAPDEKGAGRSHANSSAMGSELVEAMRASPFKEIVLEPGRERMPVRDAGF